MGNDDRVAGVVQQLRRQHSRVVRVAALDSLVTCFGLFWA